MPEQSGTSETMQTAQPSTGNVDVASIRMTLLREHPDKADQIRMISINENGGIVTLSGTIDDEQVQQQLVSRVRQMQGVRDVQNQLRSQQPMGETGQSGQPTVAVEEIRAFMLQERPNDSDIIRGLVIDENGGIVTIRGRVYDEQMKTDLSRAAKKARGVRDVKDDLQVDKGMKAKAGNGGSSATSPDQVRAAMLRERPNQSDVISALTISEQGDAIVLRGTVPDEETKKQLTDTAKKAAGGKKLKSELQVKKK